jgi:hypothetical protein
MAAREPRSRGRSVRWSGRRGKPLAALQVRPAVSALPSPLKSPTRTSTQVAEVLQEAHTEFEKELPMRLGEPPLVSRRNQTAANQIVLAVAGKVLAWTSSHPTANGGSLIPTAARLPTTFGRPGIQPLHRGDRLARRPKRSSKVNRACAFRSALDLSDAVPSATSNSEPIGRDRPDPPCRRR